MSRIDFSNLDKERKNVDSKFEKFSNFTAFIRGIILGAILTAPLQLLIKPLKYNSNTITYGQVAIQNVSTVNYITGVIFLFGIIGSICLIGYLVWIDLYGLHKVNLPYQGDARPIYDNLREDLKDECEFLDINIEAPQDEIFCRDPSKTKPDIILKFTILGGMIWKWFSSDVVLHIKINKQRQNLELEFDPEDPQSYQLIERIEQELRDNKDASEATSENLSR